MKKMFTNFLTRLLMVCSVLLLASNMQAAVYIIGEAVGSWDQFKAMSASNGVYSYSGVNPNSQFKFTTEQCWHEHCPNSEKLFEQSNPDNNQGEGATVEIKKDGNNTNLSIALASGYTTPITFYVSETNKTYWAKATKQSSTSGDYYVTGNAFAGWGTFVPMVKEANNRYSAKVTGSGNEFKVSNYSGYNDDFHKNVGADHGVSKDNNGGNASVTKQQGTVTIVYFDPTGGGGKGWLWADYIDFSLKASSHFRYDSDVDPITLTAQGTSVYDRYTWQVSNDNSTWTDLGVTTTGSFTLQGSDLPKETSYYRVIGKGTGSETFASAPIVISVLAGCGEGTRMEEIFKMDFGTLSGEKARKDVENATMATNYVFRDWPLQKKQVLFLLLLLLMMKSFLLMKTASQ